MTTFERYFVEDPVTHQEPKNPYYRLLEREDVVNAILAEFGLCGRSVTSSTAIFRWRRRRGSPRSSAEANC